MLTFHLRGINPIPKQRPRKGSNNRMYTPPRTANYQTEVGVLVKNAIVDNLMEVDDYLDKDLGIIAHFVRNNRRNVDTDNLMKSLKDALEGILWNNDRNIKGESSYLSYNKKRPGVVLVVMEYSEWLSKIPVELYAGSINDQDSKVQTKL